MKGIILALLLALLVLPVAGAPQPPADQQSGTLVFDVKNYVSAVKLPKQVQKQLEHAGVSWGLVDDSLVVPMISLKLVKPEIQYLTRFGEQKTLPVKPGEYKITCIGYDHRSNSRNMDKFLSQSVFFNIAVLTFNVLPGKTTTLEVFPTFHKQSKDSFLVTVNVFLPDLQVRVVEDGVQKSESVINIRDEKSIYWDDYHGPLKF